MSEAKYTKGPWRVGVPIADKINVSHLDSTRGAITQNLCQVAARPSWLEEGKANARLIAAAPEMMDLLREARAQLPIAAACWNDSEDETVAQFHVQRVLSLIAKIDAVIAKATEAA